MVNCLFYILLFRARMAVTLNAHTSWWDFLLAQCPVAGFQIPSMTVTTGKRTVVHNVSHWATLQKLRELLIKMDPSMLCLQIWGSNGRGCCYILIVKPSEVNCCLWFWAIQNKLYWLYNCRKSWLLIMMRWVVDFNMRRRNRYFWTD